MHAELAYLRTFSEVYRQHLRIYTEDVLRTIQGLNERERLTVLLVEQNVAQSLALAHRGYVLENGRIALSGTGPALLADDRVRRAYIGL